MGTYLHGDGADGCDVVDKANVLSAARRSDHDEHRPPCPTDFTVSAGHPPSPPAGRQDEHHIWPTAVRTNRYWPGGTTVAPKAPNWVPGRAIANTSEPVWAGSLAMCHSRRALLSQSAGTALETMTCTCALRLSGLTEPFFDDGAMSGNE